MSGNLILNTSSPTNALQAASKGYVDSKFSGINTQYELFYSFNSTEIANSTVKSNTVPEAFLDVVFDGLITGSNIGSIFLGPDNSNSFPIVYSYFGSGQMTNTPNQRFRFKFSIAPFYQYTSFGSSGGAGPTSIVSRVSAIPTVHNRAIRDFWDNASDVNKLEIILSNLGVLIYGVSFSIGSDSYVNVYIRQ